MIDFCRFSDVREFGYCENNWILQSWHKFCATLEKLTNDWTEVLCFVFAGKWVGLAEARNVIKDVYNR